MGLDHTVSIGDDDFTCDDFNNLQITNNFGVPATDRYNFDCDNMSPSTSNPGISQLGLSLGDTDQTIFADESLPQSLPDFNEFETTSFVWFFEDFFIGDEGEVRGVITSMTQLQ